MEIVALPGCVHPEGCSRAFAQVVAHVSSDQEFREAVERELRNNESMQVVCVEDVEPLVARRARAKCADWVLALERMVDDETPVMYFEFHFYPDDEVD